MFESGPWRRTVLTPATEQPIAELEQVGARAEIGMVAQVFHFYAGCSRQAGRRDHLGRRRRSTTFREPLGVVGVIVPRNHAESGFGPRARPARARGADSEIKSVFISTEG